MSAYLTEDEIAIYCTIIPHVTLADVTVASKLIDAYCGSFEVKEHTQQVRLKTKKNGCCSKLMGRLQHTPVAEILEVSTISQNIFGRSEEEDSPQSIYLEDYGYFTYIGNTPTNKLFGHIPCELKIKYTSGYTDYPEDLKIACALLAQNIVQYGGFLSWTSKKDIDYSITLADSSIFTKEIKILLDGIAKYV